MRQSKFSLYYISRTRYTWPEEHVLVVEQHCTFLFACIMMHTMHNLVRKLSMNYAGGNSTHGGSICTEHCRLWAWFLLSLGLPQAET